ncbi:hypothetical protein ACQE3E_20345 [Methylomonas sp. MED-D]|uniref:Uncharacterized protein n=1 Tax=Methylomonas koyamae TaxID=702114 RepID=A0A177N3A1_9GAMM|nr:MULTISPECIES: hypothetical protein [Methylomonas]NJA04249.1 hypothetical protein [Methylococcaceae bacterium WWC4]MDT4332204.1 hypothetical protein [Methylomonas sp. MV1]OAI12134.1 hypothetical protein A1355_14720 [Methylomonas koyamae]OHX35467.1 hypothetical protein BJL95_14580 [Methylomonas sp. LWB]WGS85624.1 hypothetical protein QC632_21725 [Methylomonas sp. UP202]
MLRRHLDLIIVGFIVLAIVMYDITLELLGELFHLLFELLHGAFEWIELGIEEAVEVAFHILNIGEVVEFLFDTGRHGSQVVTFYILMSMIGYALYRLWKIMPRIWLTFKLWLSECWVRRKTEYELYWQSLTLTHKAALLVVVVAVGYIASFFVI